MMARGGHMTTNLAECTNSILRGAWSLPISAIVKSTFQKINSWFVEGGMKTNSMLRAGHQYPEDITNLLQKNQ